MKRREFLKASAALGSAVASGTLLSAQPQNLVRGAVVIGIDKCGTLPILSAATQDAEKVGKWLREEGFEVKLFTVAPVRIRDIKDAVREFVLRGTLDQLVIYFSGHGFSTGFGECWLLSEAPDDNDEAVSVRDSIEVARESGIPSVVFISDACRSTSDSLGISRVLGSVIFPNQPPNPLRPDIDRFFATLPGSPALELPVAESVKQSQGVFTASFLTAFTNPTAGMVQRVGGVDVVTNRSLKDYLTTDVPKRASAKLITLRQLPDSVIESTQKYLGRARLAAPTPSPSPAGTPGPNPSPSVSPSTPGNLPQLVHAELMGAGVVLVSPSEPLSQSQLYSFRRSTGFDKTQEGLATPGAPVSFETGSGISVTGARLTKALAYPGPAAVEVLPPRGLPAEPAVVRVHLNGRPGASVLLRFSDGSGTCIAALAGFIASVTVSQGRVVNVSYLPSRSSPRWAEYEGQRERLALLRSIVATSAQLGGFRLEGNREQRTSSARKFADTIRVLKGIDPTLGLYAAYAYAEADLVAEVRSVFGFMSGDLQVDLYDLALLAGRLVDWAPGNAGRTVPFCPMFSQGWGLVRLRGARLAAPVDRAREHLRAGLWTTLNAPGMELLESAIQNGVV